MLCDVGISQIGIANVLRPDIVVVTYKLLGISARDVSSDVSASKMIDLEGYGGVDISVNLSGVKLVNLEGYGAVDITMPIGASKQIFIEQ